MAYSNNSTEFLSAGVRKQGYQHASCGVYDFQGTFYKRSRKVVQKSEKHCNTRSAYPKQPIFIVISNAKIAHILKVPFTGTHSLLIYF